MTNQEIVNKLTPIVANYTGWTVRVGVKGDVQVIDKKGRFAGHIDDSRNCVVEHMLGRQTLLGSLIRNDINRALKQ